MLVIKGNSTKAFWLGIGIYPLKQKGLFIDIYLPFSILTLRFVDTDYFRAEEEAHKIMKGKSQ